MSKQPAEVCPNCKKLVYGGLYSTGDIAEQFLATRHCGCYYEEPPEAENTASGDAPLWRMMPPGITHLQTRCAEAAVRVHNMMTVGPPYSFELLRGLDEAHQQFHAACMQWEQDRGGNINRVVCFCGTVFGKEEDST